MPGRISESILEEILSRVDIVELISGYIPLKRAGRNFKALCPFHQEKTSSFMVSPDRQIYHCFGCGESGNAFKFLMRYERLEFLEAVEVLSKKAGVALPEPSVRDEKAAGLVTQLYKINEQAVSFFANALNSSEGFAARDYLAKRGISQDSVKLFKLGYAPERWDGLITHLRAKNNNLGLLEKAGLVLPKNGGGYYDRFRGRIIFPIFDIKGRPLGFGGRVLSEAKTENLAKYVNSPETPIYTKGRNLFGLHLSKEAIRQKDYAVIVEGYLDFLMPYQSGLQNIVASLGTALTSEQVRLLKRFTQNVVMVYDPDTAGQMATLRTLDIFIEEGMNVKICSLPEGQDPDLFVRKAGIEALEVRIANAEGLFDYKLRCLQGRHGTKGAEGKADICGEMLATINKFQNAVLKSEYLRKLSEEMRVEHEVLLQELKKVKPDRPYAQPSAATAKKADQMNPTEKLLIKLMLEESDLIGRLRGAIEPADFQTESASRIVSIMFDMIEQGKAVEPNALVNYLEDESILQCVCESAFLPEVSTEKKEEIVHDCVQRLKKDKARLMRQRLHEQITHAQRSGDEERLHRLMQEFHQLIKTR
ncbi:MAG TPA: DNA primase [Patescibacteria group bacterium]|nr:DNA primase [Patescibacteria group bacterium]